MRNGINKRKCDICGKMFDRRDLAAMHVKVKPRWRYPDRFHYDDEGVMQCMSTYEGSLDLCPNCAMNMVADIGSKLATNEEK